MDYLKLKRSKEFYTNIIGRVPVGSYRRMQNNGYKYVVIVDGYMEQWGDVYREFYSKAISDKVLADIVKQAEKDGCFVSFGEPVWFELAELIEPQERGRQNDRGLQG